MDLREIKTKASITRAFLSLRAKKPLERITVKELAEQAQIGKATFYLHYHDIFALSDELEHQVIQEVLADLPPANVALTDPAHFTGNLMRAFIKREKRIEVLFSGSRAQVLGDSIERELKEYIFSAYPQARDNAALNVQLTYQIQGGYYAYQKNHKHFPTEQMVTLISEGAGRLKSNLF